MTEYITEFMSWLDTFNAAQVEIMSQMFVATRDGSEKTIPSDT